jgi:hypothetical protein
MQASDKFSLKRRIFFPREVFIELILSSKEASKMRRWEKANQKVVPVWSVSCDRVLFVNWAKFEKWRKRKKSTDRHTS